MKHSFLGVALANTSVRGAGAFTAAVLAAVSIGFALAAADRPNLILFDEPAEGIRPNIVGQIEDVIVRLNGERGLAGVLVEQNIAFTRHADQRFIIPAPHHPGA
jgi:ABC-type branched-subunit amino acid transport system ATPase component